MGRCGGGGGGRRGGGDRSEDRNGAIRSSFPCDQPSPSLLHALQRVPQVRRREGRGRRVLQVLRQGLPLALPNGVGREMERGARRRHVCGQVLMTFFDSFSTMSVCSI